MTGLRDSARYGTNRQASEFGYVLQRGTIAPMCSASTRAIGGGAMGGTSSSILLGGVCVLSAAWRDGVICHGISFFRVLSVLGVTQTFA